MLEITKWSACETTQRIQKKDVSVEEVTQAHFDQMESINPTIHAITEPVTEALALARTMDKAGIPEHCAALYGVPVTTKINVDQAGYANSNGIPAFAKNSGQGNSPVVSNLIKSQAIIIGRTNTPEFSMRWCTSNSLHGTSLNPWNLAITPGGSSGAAAAAVASGIGAIAHGNDLGGSLRYPAFCCGVTTIRPSFGRVPAMNPNNPNERPPLTQTMSVQGPIARSVADVRLALTAMSAADSRDPLQVPIGTKKIIADRPIKIGVCDNPFTNWIDPAISRAMKKARHASRDTGFEVIDYTPPHAEEIAHLWGQILFTEVFHTMKDSIQEHGSSQMRMLLDAYFNRFTPLDIEGLFQAMTRRIQLQRSWSLMFDDIDVLIMPTSLSRPFENDLDFTAPEQISNILDFQKPLFPVNFLGLPSVALPTHIEDGLPIGVQVIGRLHGDDFVLDVAEKIEKELGTIWRNNPLM